MNTDKDKKTIESLETAANLFNYTIDKATERGHRNATIGSGAGAGIGGIIGSFTGPLGAVGGAAFGAFLGNLIGKENDNE